MIISILFKALLFYFLYKVIKGALGAYTVYKRVQAHGQAAGGGFSRTSAGGHNRPKEKPSKASEKGTVEAEYRVLRED